MWKRMAVLAIALGLLATSGVALAADGEEEDTVFNYGYDAEAGVLVWNAVSSEGPYDCSLENGVLTTTYTRVPNGVVLVDGLADESGTVSFPALPDAEVDQATVEYSGPDGECALEAGTVAGPNGQINHGMFMKLFNSLYDGRGRGCLNRHLAQSDLGKGDQQVRVDDVDAEAGAEELTEGTVEFETVTTDCVSDEEDGEKVTGQEKAAQKRGDQAEKKGPDADRQRGNSASAPGRNK